MRSQDCSIPGFFYSRIFYPRIFCSKIFHARIFEPRILDPRIPRSHNISIPGLSYSRIVRSQDSAIGLNSLASSVTSDATLLTRKQSLLVYLQNIVFTSASNERCGCLTRALFSASPSILITSSRKSLYTSLGFRSPFTWSTMCKRFIYFCSIERQIIIVASRPHETFRAVATLLPLMAYRWFIRDYSSFSHV